MNKPRVRKIAGYWEVTCPECPSWCVWRLTLADGYRAAETHTHSPLIGPRRSHPSTKISAGDAVLQVSAYDTRPDAYWYLGRGSRPLEVW